MDPLSPMTAVRATFPSTPFQYGEPTNLRVLVARDVGPEPASAIAKFVLPLPKLQHMAQPPLQPMVAYSSGNSRAHTATSPLCCPVPSPFPARPLALGSQRDPFPTHPPDRPKCPVIADPRPLSASSFCVSEGGRRPSRGTPPTTRPLQNRSTRRKQIGDFFVGPWVSRRAPGRV